MSVERIAHAERQEIVDEHVTRRRYPQADDVVDVEAVEGRTVDACDRVGEDEAAQHQVHRRPHEGGDQVPEGHVERRLEPLRRSSSGTVPLHDATTIEDRNFGEQRELAASSP